MAKVSYLSLDAQKQLSVIANKAFSSSSISVGLCFRGAESLNGEKLKSFLEMAKREAEKINSHAADFLYHYFLSGGNLQDDNFFGAVNDVADLMNENRKILSFSS